MLGSKQCRVIVAYGNYRVGDVIWPSGAYRDHLLRNGYIEIVPQAEPPSEFATEVQTTEPPRETATRRRRNTAWDR